MATGPSANTASRVVDRSLKDAKEELKKNVKRLLIQNLRRNVGERDGQLVPAVSGSPIATCIRDETDLSDSQVARYLKQRGYQYTLSVLMAEANVPDSGILSSLAVSLNDSRSQLVAGHPDFQAAILQIWEEIENRYRDKLKNQTIDWEMKQKVQLKQMERILRQHLVEEEEEMKRQISTRLAGIEEKEDEVERTIRERETEFEQRLDGKKRQLLADANELDEKRRGLHSLETELRRQVESEQDRIRRVKEDLNQLSLELKRQQMQLTFQMDDAVKEARRHEQIRYAEKLQVISRKEEKLREVIEKAKANKGEVEVLKVMLYERDNKIQELELNLQQCKMEMVNSKDRLKERENNIRRMSDYDTMKTEVARLREEIRSNTEHMNMEKRSLRERNYELEGKCRNLTAQIQEWNPSDENPFKNELAKARMEFEKAKVEWKTSETYYRKQLEEEKAKNDQMKQKLDEQTERLQYLSETVKKLNALMLKGRFMSGLDTGRLDTGGRIANVSEFGGVADGDGDDPTPDYLKEAKRRLKLLEKETHDFEESLHRYQKSSIDSSSLTMWQARAASSAYAFVDGDEAVHLRDDRQFSQRGDQIGTRAPVVELGNVLSRSEAVQHLLPSTDASFTRPLPSPLEPKEPVEDDWETKLRRREEERRERDELLRRRQEEELAKTREKENEKTTSVEAEDTSKPKDADASTSGLVDPVLQKYMQMVMEQRGKEKQVDKANLEPSDPERVTKEEHNVEERDVEVAVVKEPSSGSDFEW